MPSVLSGLDDKEKETLAEILKGALPLRRASLDESVESSSDDDWSDNDWLAE